MNGMVFTHLAVMVGACLILGGLLGSLVRLGVPVSGVPVVVVMAAVLAWVAIDQLLSAYDRWGKGRERP